MTYHAPKSLPCHGTSAAYFSVVKVSLGPWGILFLHLLTVKTVFPLAASMARPRSKFHALFLKPHLRWEPRGVQQIPHLGFLTKNQSPNFSTPDIFVVVKHAFQTSRMTSCPVHILKYFILFGRKGCGVTQCRALFIMTVLPYHAASAATSAMWIVEAMNPT